MQQMYRIPLSVLTSNRVALRVPINHKEKLTVCRDHTRNGLLMVAADLLMGKIVYSISHDKVKFRILNYSPQDGVLR